MWMGPAVLTIGNQFIFVDPGSDFQKVFDCWSTNHFKLVVKGKMSNYSNYIQAEDKDGY